MTERKDPGVLHLRRLGEIPLPLRHVVLAAVVLGTAGAIAGMVVGLIVHPPTAWFAMIELGLPGAIVGAAAGLVSGLVTQRVQIRRRARRA